MFRQYSFSFHTNLQRFKKILKEIKLSFVEFLLQKALWNFSFPIQNGKPPNKNIITITGINSHENCLPIFSLRRTGWLVKRNWENRDPRLVCLRGRRWNTRFWTWPLSLPPWHPLQGNVLPHLACQELKQFNQSTWVDLTATLYGSASFWCQWSFCRQTLKRSPCLRGPSRVPLLEDGVRPHPGYNLGFTKSSGKICSSTS